MMMREGHVFTLILAISLMGMGVVVASKTGGSYPYPFQDPSVSLDDRIANLISLLTLEEKVLQLSANMSGGGGVPPIARLNISAYNWATECLRGDVGNNATSFPQALGMAATWDAPLVHDVGVATSDEVRAYYNYWKQQGTLIDTHHGVTCWSPVINILRDPRWGRAQETYGEDPYLTAQTARAYLTGLQNGSLNIEGAPEVIATCKHFSAHSGPDNIPSDRSSFNTIVSDRDWRTTYLPAFRACVEAGVGNIMCSYNAINGIPACANDEQMNGILRGEWGYQGMVTSDCGAIWQIQVSHNYVNSSVEASALALKAGCDIECDCCGAPAYFPLLYNATEEGLVTEDMIDTALARVLSVRFRLGTLDPPGYNLYDGLQIDETVFAPHHTDLAIRTALESIVLLQNRHHVLPLKPSASAGPICVLGPNANNPSNLAGDYNPVPYFTITPLQGIQSWLSANEPSVSTVYDPACLDDVFCTQVNSNLSTIIKPCQSIVLFMGTSAAIESEANDRANTSLPGLQQQVIQTALSRNVPTVVVFLNGGALSIPWVQENVDGILEMWFPGEQGGVIANVLFGDYSPAGRLPATWYQSDSQIPPMTDYNMTALPYGRTYRYFTATPLFSFGFGLSYTTFSYANPIMSPMSGQTSPCQSLGVSVDVVNSGSVDSDEVVQLYVRTFNASVPLPQIQLLGYIRVHIPVGTVQRVSFLLNSEDLSVLRDPDFVPVVEPGIRQFWIGGGQPNSVPEQLPGVSGQFTVVGTVTPLASC